MNKRVLTSYVLEPNILQPFTIEQLDWVQANVVELTTNLVKGIIGFSAVTNACIIDGQTKDTIKTNISGTTYSYSPCYIYEPSTSQIFLFSGATSLDSSLGEYFHISTSFPDPSDPLLFSDGITSQNVMELRSLDINNTSTGALFSFSNLEALRDDWIKIGTTAGAPAFQNSWSSNTPALRISKESKGIVHIDGVCYNSTSINNVVFTLPSGYRPSQLIQNNIYSSTDNYAQIQIASNGEVSIVCVAHSPGYFEAYISLSFPNW